MLNNVTESFKIRRLHDLRFSHSRHAGMWTRITVSIFLLMLFFRPYCMSQQIAGTDRYILDMVHNNPGEPLTKTAFNDPVFLKNNGYNGLVMNDFTFVHAAITYDSFDKRIFPEGSEARAWVLAAASKVKENIRRAHAAGIKVYYFTDIIVLPKRLVELYKDQICDDKGRISFERPFTIELHRKMLNEVFDTFPDLDGLVIRTGETYLNNVPYHTGNNPITNGPESHVKLINLLREEVCVKRNKTVFYRTWSFGGMHDDPDYYLKVTNRIEPHPNLIFSIKHTQGDYHRTFNFNPTLGIGKHHQIVEVECQREYEGKGAFPNYIGEGVINGFEEYSGISPQKGFKSLEEIKKTKQFAGVWTWSRGGGWVGPYIQNEFWCRLNAYVISNWGKNTTLNEEQEFNKFMDQEKITGSSRTAFRSLCMLSAKAVLRGHESALSSFDKDWVWWTRDQFLDGTRYDLDSLQKGMPKTGILFAAFEKLYGKGELFTVVKEKDEAVRIWKDIVSLSQKIVLPNEADQHYLLTSSMYGLLLHKVISSGWHVMALGFEGDNTGHYDLKAMREFIKEYDLAWSEYKQLKVQRQDCATLYQPYAFLYKAPDYHGLTGLQSSIDHYRKISFPIIK